MQANSTYPVIFSVDYPDHGLHRASTVFRVIIAIPILIVLAAVSATAVGGGYESSPSFAIAGGLLFLPPLLMIVFRQKYPRWWFDWNIHLLRFSNRVGAYLALMDDRYPSTDEEQHVHLDVIYPDAKRDLNRWLPLVKWFLVIPHVIILAFLFIALIIATLFAWFAILFTGRYPQALFRFIEGVMRWYNRVVAYTLILATDRYPPFTLSGS